MGLLLWSALWRKPTAAVFTLLATTAAFTLFGLMFGLYITKQHMLDRIPNDQAWIFPRFTDIETRGFPIAMEQEIGRIRGVAAIGAYKDFAGYRKDPSDHIYMWLMDRGMRASRPDGPLTSAQWDQLLSDPSGVFVTRTRAEAWNLETGDTFVVTTPPRLRADGGTTWMFHVLGIVPEDYTVRDGRMFGNVGYVQQAASPEFANWGYEFWVRIKDPSHATEVCRAIDQHFATTATPTYCLSIMADALENAKTNVNKVGTILGIAGAGLFMILFLVANAVARSVYERMAEFAVLHALGFRQSYLERLVALEAACPYLLGAVLGTIGAAILVKIPERFVPHDLTFLTVNMFEPGLPGSTLAWAIGAAITLAFLSSAIPMLRLRRRAVSEILAGR